MASPSALTSPLPSPHGSPMDCLRSARCSISLPRLLSRGPLVCPPPLAAPRAAPAPGERKPTMRAHAGAASKTKERTSAEIERENEGELVPVHAQTEKEGEGVRKGKKSKNKKRKIKFVKYQGLGNDFIMIDNLKQSEPLLTPKEAVQVCDRNFGIGGDGVIFLLPGKKGTEAEYGMRIFNSDGSEPEMCGNGIRCLARFLAELEGHEGSQRYTVWTLAGNMVLSLKEDGQVQVDMGEPILSGPHIPTTLPPTAKGQAVIRAPLEIAGHTWSVTCVSMGNPHCVVYSSSKHPDGLDVLSLDLHTLGPQFENHPSFPARINTEFVEVVSRNEVRMRVWERGAGPTLACGTGACALVVAGVLEGRVERSCLVHLPGGPLEIEWRAEDNHVYMTGPAEEVFSGKFQLPALA